MESIQKDYRQVRQLVCYNNSCCCTLL